MENIYKSKLNSIAELLYQYDPVQLGSLENNLTDEYIDEAEAILYNHEESKINNKSDLRNCMTVIFEEYFSKSIKFTFKDSLIEEIYSILNNRPLAKV